MISRVPACDSSHALSKLCTLACSRGLTVTSDSQYVNATRISQKLTHTVHGLHDGLARPKTGPRTGPRTGLRPGGDARADPSAVARDPAHHFSPLRPSRVVIRSTVFHMSDLISDHVISTRLVFSNAQSHTITTHAHGSPTVSDLLAGPTRERARPVENNQHQCPCPCAMPMYMQRYTRVMLPLRLRFTAP